MDRRNWLFRGFRDVVVDCGLHDLPLQGYPFTWARSKGTVDGVEERLDRAMVSSAWLDLFPHVRLSNLMAPISDHSSILLQTKFILPFSAKKRFRFENRWLKEQGLYDIVYEFWHSSYGSDLISRFSSCVSSLHDWGRSQHRIFRDQIYSCKAWYLYFSIIMILTLWHNSQW